MLDLTAGTENLDQSKEEWAEIREQNRLKTLHKLLTLDNWSMIDACNILAGVNPKTPISEARLHSGEIQLRLLPGLAIPGTYDDWEGLYSALSDAYGRIWKRLMSVDDVGSKSPSYLVDICIKSHLAPPWLKCATKDQDCTHFLSDKARNFDTLQPPLRGREKSRQGGIDKAKKYYGEMENRVVGLLEEKTLHGVPEHWRHKSSGRLHWKRISLELLNEETFPKNSVRRDDFNYQSIAGHIKIWFNNKNLS